MVDLNLSTSLVLFYYVAVILFLFSFTSSFAVISYLITWFFKLKCIIVCCNPEIIIDHIEIGGVDKDGM